jgi:hypothetical protein
MRKLTDHKLPGLNEAIDINVTDEPGAGGACHRYNIDVATRHVENIGDIPKWRTEVRFQNGPVQEAGANGISQEALLAVVIDRLRSFQSGPYACRENAVALTKCEEAMMWLQKRTRDRLARGVEGTSAK